MKRPSQKQTPIRDFRISANFSNAILCPENSIEPAFWKRDPKDDFRLVTMDGKRCMARFLSSYHEDEETLDFVSRKRWNCPFSAVRSMWIARLGSVGEYWHVIELQL